jgi:type I restriction-modification system DNA methylase subunit
MAVAYQKRQQTIFSTIKSEGAILPMDLLQRISDPQNTQLAGLTPDAYHLPSTRLNEAINRAWTSLLGIWQRFQSEKKKLSEHETGTTLTRERWLLPLFNELGYGRLQTKPAIVVGERSYPISHGWEHTPIHLVSYKVDLDRSVQSESGARRSSPHSLLQELLNRSQEHLWGMVSNGLTLRILRNNVSLTRQAYVEFDLEEMFHNEVYADFVLLWLLCHQSRVEFTERPADCWLEKWSQEAHATGTRALDALRENVERAISELGSGFLSHPANGPLRDKLSAGTLSAMGYYNQLLRMVYRLLVLFVAEDREILFDPAALPAARELYRQYYSTARLRAQADRQLGTRHSDLYYGLKLVMEKLGQENGCLELGLPGLNGFLFSSEAMSDLNDCQLANYALLAAVRHLGYTESGRTRRIIDYKNLGSEELGSVYESLLELHPVLHLDTGKFELASASGNQRKTTGSYYTPTSLITCLLDSALDPVLNEAADKATVVEAEEAILNLKICDPACGSGHFLVAAAHRVAKKLAAVRTGDEEPSPEARRHALRDVVGRCIYGVDINPMAVELCKVSLWMEAIEPGKPLSFLDAHIQRGNSLLGTTPALLKNGIPNEAFEPIEGDDKKICSEFKKLNNKLREGNTSLFREDQDTPIWEQQGTLVHSMLQLDDMREDTVADVRNKDAFFKKLRASGAYENALLWANAWCAAFVWKKTADMRPPITNEEFRDIGQNPFVLAPWRRKEIERLAAQYQFFHWHLAFPDVFRVPGKDEEAENEQAGWSGGFDVVLGNPPYIFGEGHSHRLKSSFQSMYELAAGQYDLYWLFIEQGLKMTDSRGRFSLVVPDSLLARDESQKARKLLIQEGIEHIYHCGEVFEDANVSTIVFTLNRENDSTTVFCGTLEEFTARKSHTSSRELFSADSMNRLLIHISYEEARILARVIRECQPLQNFVKISRGEEIGKKGVLPTGSVPILVGSDISRYYLAPPSRFLSKFEKDSSIYHAPKIIVVKTGSKCIASLDLNGYVTMQSVYNLHLTIPDIAEEVLLALLNSRFVQYFIYKTFTSYKSLFPQLNQSTLQAIPVPTSIYDQQKDLIALVQEIQANAQALRISQTSQRESAIKKQFDVLDKKLDVAIYSLYGLTAEEIAILEKNTF